MMKRNEIEDKNRDESQTQYNRRSVLKLAGAAGGSIGAGISVSALGTEFIAPAHAATNVIDDFTNTNLTGRYYFETGSSYASVDTVSNKATSEADDNVLKISGGTTEMVAYKDDGDTNLDMYPEIGDTIRCWVRGVNGTENMNVTYGAVASDGKDDHYYIKVDFGDNLLGMGKTDDGSSTWLESSNDNLSLAADTWYKLEIDWSTDHNHTVTLYDGSGSEVGSLTYQETSNDPKFEGRGIGFDAYTSSGETAYFDYATRANKGLIDDFEDGNLAEYSGNTSLFSIQSSTVLEGSQTLRCDDNYAKVSHNSFQTTRGNEYRARIMADTDTNPSLLANVQDPSNPMNNCYWASADPANNELTLWRREGGSSYQIDAVSVTIDVGVEYQIGLQLHDSKIRAVLYDETGNEIGKTAKKTDQTFTSGYIGVYSGGSGTPTYYDEIREHTLINIKGNSASTTQSEAEDALNTQVAQDVMADLNNPSVDTANASKFETYINGQKWAETEEIPIDYGTLRVTYQGSSAVDATAYLDRSTMSSSLRSELSDDIGWPSGTEAVHEKHKDWDQPYFARNVTDGEKNDMDSLTGEKDGHAYAAWNDTNGSGRYQAVYHTGADSDTEYLSDETISSITNESRFPFGDGRCPKLARQCAFDVLTAGVGCGSISIPICTLAFSLGPLAIVSAPITCVVGFLATCGPEALLFAASTACDKYVRDC